MNITRNTMRADGITVGQAMDQDAAFLRSVGIPAPCGQQTHFEKLEAYKEKVRQAVLEALDAVDGKEWSDKAHPGGWRDQDLPALFRAIDKQAEAQFNRVNHV